MPPPDALHTPEIIMLKRKKKAPVSHYRKTGQRKLTWAVASLATLAVACVLAGWGFAGPSRPTAEQAKATLTSEEGLAQLQALPPEERKAKLAAYGRAISTDIGPGREGERRRPPENDPLRQNLEKLSPEDREAFRRGMFDNMRAQRQKQEDEKIQAFFKATPEEQQKLLAEEIAKQQQRQQERQNRPRPEQSAANPQAGKDGKPGDAGNAKPGDNNRPRGNWASVPKEKREDHMRERLDSSDPDTRALRTEYYNRLREAAKAAEKK